MTVPKIEAFFEERQARATLSLRVYALVDGLLYGKGRLTPSSSTIALFDTTTHASLADAGPWLIDYEAAPSAVRQALASQSAGPNGVSWLISAYPMPALADELREHLEARLPGNRRALLRFYDARLMPDIASLLEFTQRMQFFVTTTDWLVEINGQLTKVHPRA